MRQFVISRKFYLDAAVIESQIFMHPKFSEARQEKSNVILKVKLVNLPNYDKTTPEPSDLMKFIIDNYK